MSGLTPLAPPAGLTSLGADDAGMCVDGVCAVPDHAAVPTEPADTAARTAPDPTR